MKFLIASCLFALVLCYNFQQSLGDELVDWYSCADKADGNYPHPSDCTKFMSCVAHVNAYERSCKACDDSDQKNCPKGKLQYSAASDTCLPASEAPCVTG